MVNFLSYSWLVLALRQL